MKRSKRAAGLGYGTLSTLLGGAALASVGLSSAGLLSGDCATRARAVDVKGSVRAMGDAPAPKDNAVRPAYWQEWNGFIEPKKPVADLTREVAVVLIGSAATRDSASMVMKDGQLTPSTVVMQQGTSLRVRNEDDFVHKLFVEGLKAFDAIETSSGQGRQVQIDQVGTFAVRDALSPHVGGTLHVLAKLTAVASPQADGSFVFPEVAPGSYTLKVFRGATEVSSKTLELDDQRELVIDPINIDLQARK
jgi:hypothetical protein